MTSDAPITWLMFFTLAAGILISAGMFIAFLRSRHNREIAANVLEGDGRSRSVAPSGAGAELIGIFVAAMIVMALLTWGYQYRGGTEVVAAPAAGAKNQPSAQWTDPNMPKPYQPANPAADLRSSPTGSTTGQGSDSGGRPEGQRKE